VYLNNRIFEPGLVIYTDDEVMKINEAKIDEEGLRDIHMVKKHLNGTLVKFLGKKK